MSDSTFELQMGKKPSKLDKDGPQNLFGNFNKSEGIDSRIDSCNLSMFCKTAINVI